MSDDLRKLIEAVECGDLASVNRVLGELFAADHSLPWSVISNANSAYRGSVDAAIALCEALLPGWKWAVYGDGHAHLWLQLNTADGDASTPARALLLAVLRAKLMEVENG